MLKKLCELCEIKYNHYKLGRNKSQSFLHHQNDLITRSKCLKTIEFILDSISEKELIISIFIRNFNNNSKIEPDKFRCILKVIFACPWNRYTHSQDMHDFITNLLDSNFICRVDLIKILFLAIENVSFRTIIFKSKEPCLIRRLLLPQFQKKFSHNLLHKDFNQMIMISTNILLNLSLTRDYKKELFKIFGQAILERFQEFYATSKRVFHKRTLNGDQSPIINVFAMVLLKLLRIIEGFFHVNTFDSQILCDQYVKILLDISLKNPLEDNFSKEISVFLSKLIKSSLLTHYFFDKNFIHLDNLLLHGTKIHENLFASLASYFVKHQSQDISQEEEMTNNSSNHHDLGTRDRRVLLLFFFTKYLEKTPQLSISLQKLSPFKQRFLRIGRGLTLNLNKGLEEKRTERIIWLCLSSLSIYNLRNQHIPFKVNQTLIFGGINELFQSNIDFNNVQRHLEGFNHSSPVIECSTMNQCYVILQQLSPMYTTSLEDRWSSGSAVQNKDDTVLQILDHFFIHKHLCRFTLDILLDSKSLERKAYQFQYKLQKLLQTADELLIIHDQSKEAIGRCATFYSILIRLLEMARESILKSADHHLNLVISLLRHVINMGKPILFYLLLRYLSNLTIDQSSERPARKAVEALACLNLEKYLPFILHKDYAKQFLENLLHLTAMLF